MAQFARPTSDVTNDGAWTTAPLWSDLDDAVGSGDGSVVLSDTSPLVSETFVVAAGSLTDPQVSTGHVLRMRGAKIAASGANYDIVCELRQDYVSEASLGTLIATAQLTAKADATLETATHALTAGEADTITDYTALSFRCWGAKNGGGANSQVQIADVELETPDPPPPAVIPNVVMAPRIPT